MFKKLQNKKAEGYIDVAVAVLVIVFLLVFSVGIFSKIAVKQDLSHMCSELLLDSYVTKEAIEYYDAFKQGKPYREYIDENELVDGAYSKIGFPWESTTEYTPGDNRYVMYRPSITPLSGDSVGVNVSYTLSIPFELWGRKIADITIPVEIVSKLTERNG